ncbi:transglutaminase-like domain-containing protein [Rhodopirellula sp. P2]|uniref:transglutaminase-like domain-containing protein n=1 Tax=Rhodopirellula sp. P2 TaxID=2127060 RepID=UPI0023674F07|nr:transglutaminase-like domain-containing protein [Rhodopirellula sp. P2]WDQ18578.1 transglutaminase-like domain-containing protein [Rhodopirellula sp. P2]
MMDRTASRRALARFIRTLPCPGFSSILPSDSNAEKNRVGKVFTLACLTAALLPSGCDLPDRYDIQTFEKPAPWQAETTPSFASQARNTARPSSAADAMRQSGMPEILAPNQTPSNTIETVSGKPHSQASAGTIENRLADEWESWQIHSLRSTILGGIHAKSTRTADNEIKVELEEQGLTYRGMLQILESNQQTFWHDANGNLKKVDCTFRRGPIESHRTIEITANEVQFVDNRLVATKKKTLPIHSPLGGPLHVYQTLRRKPLQEGEIREANVLLPILGEVATLRLQHNSLASPSVLTPQGFQEVVLQEASCLLSLGPQRQRESVYWFDDQGQVQLYHVANEQRFSYGCNASQYKLLGQEFLRQDYPIALQVQGKPLETEASLLAGDLQQVGYEIIWAKPPAPESVAADPPGEANEPEPSADNQDNQIALAPRQYLRRNGDQAQQKLIVSRTPVPASKLRDRFDQFGGESTPADLAATSLVDYRSATVRRIANATANSPDFTLAERAMEMNRTVHSLLSFQPLSQGMRAASQIADSSTADSTEQSILLMALLRSAGIPSRMALGIRYQSADHVAPNRDIALPFQTRARLPDGNRFVYHAWVVAKVDDQWISLDPVAGTETQPDCLAIETTDMKDIDPIELIEAFIDKLSRMQISIYAVIRGG